MSAEVAGLIVPVRGDSGTWLWLAPTILSTAVEEEVFREGTLVISCLVTRLELPPLISCLITWLVELPPLISCLVTWLGMVPELSCLGK